MEITQKDLEAITKQIEKGFRRGIIDLEEQGEKLRIVWDLKLDKFKN